MGSICSSHSDRAARTLQKLVLLDYAIVYSEDTVGASSLHTPVPLP